MKPRTNNTLPDSRKLNFAICNIGPELFIGEGSESPKGHYASSKATASFPTNHVRPRQLSLSSPSKLPVKGKSTSSRKESGQYKRQTSDEMLNKPGNLHDLDTPVHSEGKEKQAHESAPTSRRVSIVNVISLNEQAKVKKSFIDDLDYWEDPHQKFTKKYDHFKRTQNKAQVKRLGRFKSLAEIENRASLLNGYAEMYKNTDEKQPEKKKGSFTEREKRSKDVAQMRTKLMNERLYREKCQTERDTYKDGEQRNESLPSIQRYNTMEGMKAAVANVSMPTQEGPFVRSILENKQPINSSFSHGNNYKELEQGLAGKAHQVKLPQLRVLMKKKSVDYSSDRNMFSLDSSIVNNMHMKRKAKMRSGSQITVKVKSKGLDKSHSLNVSFLIEEKIEKSKIETSIAVMESQEKMTVNVKKETKRMLLTTEMIQHGISKKSLNANHLANMAKSSVKRAPVQVGVIRSDIKVSEKRYNTVIKKRDTIEDFVNTKLEGWGSSVDLMRGERSRVKARMFDE